MKMHIVQTLIPIFSSNLGKAGSRNLAIHQVSYPNQFLIIPRNLCIVFIQSQEEISDLLEPLEVDRQIKNKFNDILLKEMRKEYKNVKL